MGKPIDQFFVVIISRDNYQKYEELILEIGKVVSTGLESDNDYQEVQVINQKLKELREEKKELLAKLRTNGNR